MACAVTSTTAPLPLSQMAVISAIDSRVPATGSGRSLTTRCSPCTSMAGLNVPIVPKAPETSQSTTAMVGSTRWVTSIEFSVTNGRSAGSTGCCPAPTPTA